MPEEVTQIQFDPANWLLKKIISITKNTNLIGYVPPDPDPVLGREDDLRNQFDIFPNPTQKHVSITTDQSNYTIQLIDLRGWTLLRSENLMGTQQLNLDAISPGIYLLRISNAEQTFTHKITID
jgi:hypothetical protein